MISAIWKKNKSCCSRLLGVSLLSFSRQNNNCNNEKLLCTDFSFISPVTRRNRRCQFSYSSSPSVFKPLIQVLHTSPGRMEHCFTHLTSAFHASFRAALVSGIRPVGQPLSPPLCVELTVAACSEQVINESLENRKRPNKSYWLFKTQRRT